MSQIVGMTVALIIAIAVGEPAPLPPDLAWSAAGSVAGGVGITALYHGLSVGRMGIVAPITAVIAALIPVGVGILVEGVPPWLVLVGIALAIAAVVLVSRVADDAPHGDAPRESGFRFALLGGIGIGAFSVCLAQIGDGHTFWPLALIRGLEGVLLACVILVTRSAWRALRGCSRP